MVKSPCINICSLDPNTNLCLGCGRSVIEITNWTHLSDDKKNKILVKLERNNISRIGNRDKFKNINKL